MSPLLDIRNLTISFAGGGRALPLAGSGQSFLDRIPPKKERVAAVRDLSFTIAPGEVLGLVGESGSGKSVTSLAIMGLLPASAAVSGEISFRNGDASPFSLLTLPPESLRELRGSRIAMIFQEPMTALNPVMRVGDQIAEAVLAHNRVPTEVHQKMWDDIRNGNHTLSNEWYGRTPLWFRALGPILAYQLGGIGLKRRIRPEKAYELAIQALRDVAIPDPEQRARSYPHQLSGGMRQRVMIAMAIVNRPQLLIADEPTTALDVTIQAQILELLNELRRTFGLAMLFISHDLAVVSHVAHRVAVMYAGSLVELGSKTDIFHAPAHPYTRGLLRSIPTLATDRAQPLATIEGMVPPIAALPPGCPFEPRCEHRVAACAAQLPPLIEVSPGHWARCPVLNASAANRASSAAETL